MNASDESMASGGALSDGWIYDEPAECIVNCLSAEERFILALTYQQVAAECFHDCASDILEPETLLSYVNFLAEVWSNVEKHNSNSASTKRGECIRTLAFKLSGFGILTRDAQDVLTRLNSRYNGIRAEQRRIDRARLERDEPILLPEGFPLRYAPRQAVINRNLVNLEEGQYKYVSLVKFREQYASLLDSVRVIDANNPLILDKMQRNEKDWWNDVGAEVFERVEDFVRDIDQERGTKEAPILLPMGFRLLRPGLLWDGEQSYRMEAKQAAGCFEYNEKHYKYVELDEFIGAYYLPFRPDATPAKIRVACDFYNAFHPILAVLRENRDPAVGLADAVSKCFMNEQVVASLKHQRIPGCLSNVIILAAQAFPGQSMSDALETWTRKKIPDWVQDFQSYEHEFQQGNFILPPDISHQVFSEICRLVFNSDHSMSNQEAGFETPQTLCQDLNAPNPEASCIPTEHRTAMMSMTCAAEALKLPPKKLKKIVDARSGCRMHLKGQSYVFDTRVPPFDELIGWDPPPRKRKNNRQT